MLFNGNGTKFLCGDGVYRSNLTKPYTGSFAGLTGKFLMLCTDATVTPARIT